MICCTSALNGIFLPEEIAEVRTKIHALCDRSVEHKGAERSDKVENNRLTDKEQIVFELLRDNVGRAISLETLAKKLWPREEKPDMVKKKHSICELLIKLKRKVGDQGVFEPRREGRNIIGYVWIPRTLVSPTEHESDT